jgi:serine/threonine protein kinase
MEDDQEHQGLMKMPRSPKDSDLMQAEATALKTLGGNTDRYRIFVPSLVESFRHRDRTTKVERRVNVTEISKDRFYSLSEVHDEHPRGLDPRDAAWMFRRLLTAIGYAHQHGIIHGAVLPENILILPGEHGLVLVDWCYSVSTDSPLRAMVTNRAPFYPHEVADKEPATSATDIHMAARTLEWLMGERAGKPLRAFVRGCTLESEAQRPHDAWKLLKEFDDLIERLWGPRKFRAFSMDSD